MSTTYKIEKDKNFVYLIYSPNTESNWLNEKLEDDEEVPLAKHAFFVTINDLANPVILNKETPDTEFIPENKYIFNIGECVKKHDGNYYKFRDALGIEYDLYIHEDLNFNIKHFKHKQWGNIFMIIQELLDKEQKEISIGPHKLDTFSLESFKKMIKEFPNDTELKHYERGRIDVAIRDFVQTKKNFEDAYIKYMNKKPSIKGDDLVAYFKKYETDKYKNILKKLLYMLKHENSYNEHQWQDEILQIVKLIFPKYIASFKGIKVRDKLMKKNRFLDIMLIDANGHIDLIEIKKPFSNATIVSKRTYRDNYVPTRELSGGIMQLEKYIMHLNRWGNDGEESINKQLAGKLPNGIKAKITNPQGMMIMGRENNLTKEQHRDLEVIKRKYKNLIDIITYDDLIKRLENIIKSFTS